VCTKLVLKCKKVVKRSRRCFLKCGPLVLLAFGLSVGESEWRSLFVIPFHFLFHSSVTYNERDSYNTLKKSLVSWSVYERPLPTWGADSYKKSGSETEGDRLRVGPVQLELSNDGRQGSVFMVTKG